MNTNTDFNSQNRLKIYSAHARPLSNHCQLPLWEKYLKIDDSEDSDYIRISVISIKNLVDL